MPTSTGMIKYRMVRTDWRVARVDSSRPEVA